MLWAMPGAEQGRTGGAGRRWASSAVDEARVRDSSVRDAGRRSASSKPCRGARAAAPRGDGRRGYR